MKANERIIINQSLVAKKESLYLALEKLYLGESKVYQLYMDRSNLPLIEKFFDQIIMNWGWRPVEFLYTLSQKHKGKS